MDNEFEQLPVTPGNGVGAPVDTSAMGGTKTITVQDDFRGSVNIEISIDDGGSWTQIATFTNTGKKLVRFAAQKMRARRIGVPIIDPGLPNIDVSADGNGALFASLPDDGTLVDTSLFGKFKTVTVQELESGNTVNIQVSDDNVRWATCMTFKASGVKTREFSAKYMRADADSSAIAVGAVNDANPAQSDELVKVSANDTTAAFLDSKLSQGSGIELTELNDGNDESIRIAAKDIGAENVQTDVPVRVRGVANIEGVSTKLPRADHQHRLELEVLQEGGLKGARPRVDFKGAGVGVVDNVAGDSVQVTIPGNVGNGSVVTDWVYRPDKTSTSSPNNWVDALSGEFAVAPMDGDYYVVFEGESWNQSGSGELELAVGVNSTTVPAAESEREGQGNSNDRRSTITTVHVFGLTAGDKIHGIFRKKSGAGAVSMQRRRLTILKTQ